jgi:type II secretory ATPase GspE/PulE/Tfp pilus assembly ATPase PilB-like protein
VSGSGVTPDALREAAAGELAARLPARFLEEQLLLPVAVATDGALVVAAGRPLDVTITDELVRRFGRALRIVDVPAQELQAALMGAGRTGEASDEAARSAVTIGDDDLGMGELRAQANDAPVVQLVNAVLSDALRTRASDVHLESTRAGLRLRLRLDGVLRDVASYPLALQAGVVSRIKLLAGLDIAERRLPQDGRIRASPARPQARSARLDASRPPRAKRPWLRILDHTRSIRRARLRMSWAWTRIRCCMSKPQVAQRTAFCSSPGPPVPARRPRSMPRSRSATMRHEDRPPWKTRWNTISTGSTQTPCTSKIGASASPTCCARMLRHDPDM